MLANQESGTQKPSDYTILIVDDESIARDILKGHLITEGYNLVSVSSGFQALQHLERNPVDLVLLDVMMPYMDGFEVCRQIKKDERWRDIPVILVTAVLAEEHGEFGVEALADGFLQKPINGVGLRKQVRSLLHLAYQ